MVEKNTSQETLLETFLEKGHSRIPIYEGRKENIVGIFYVEGLLYQIQNPDLFQLEDLTFDPYFVDETMKINHLMREFQKRKVQIAIVQKEGKALGLVTLEDLIEEIVGEIEEKSPLS
jgi:CBS domain containing-hemolysin-like protein